MTTLELDDNTVDALRKTAEARGMSVESYLRTLAGTIESSAGPSLDLVREFDDALDELFAADTRPLPSDALTYSREDIYLDHD